MKEAGYTGKAGPDVVGKRDVPLLPETISRSFSPQLVTEICELTLTIHKVTCFFFNYHIYSAFVAITQVQSGAKVGIQFLL